MITIIRAASTISLSQMARMENLALALETKKYIRTQGRLRQNHGAMCYCIIGIACNEYDQSKWQECPAVRGTYGYTNPYNVAQAPQEVLDAYGWTTLTAVELSYLNDIRQMPLKDFVPIIRALSEFGWVAVEG